MISAMETIYDVFRALVNAARAVLPDTDIAKALAVIDKADPSVETPEATDA